MPEGLYLKHSIVGKWQRIVNKVDAKMGVGVFALVKFASEKMHEIRIYTKEWSRLI